MDNNHTLTNGASSTAQPSTNGEKKILRRTGKKTNPFGTARQSGSLTLPNGQKAMLQSSTTASSVLPQRRAPAANSTAKVAMRSDPNSDQYSGFSDPNIGQTQYTDYKLVATKKDLLEGLRFHVMHLTGVKDKFDLRDPSQFVPPGHLHRRDPRATAPEIKDDEEQVDLKDGLNDEERQALKDRNEQRKVERAANLALIAPTQTSRKNQSHKLKTKAVVHREWTKEERERIQTNYEEKLPWMLEDFDNQHCFVGKHLAPSTKRHVALAHEPVSGSRTGQFRLIPVEKFYEFQPKRKAQPEGTLEEAEAKMRARAHISEWNLQVESRALERKRKELLDRAPRLYTGENKDNRLANRDGEDGDMDHGDDEEIFADDEEGDTIRVKNEEEALIEKRIKEDQLKANFFEVKDEADYDFESDKEKKEEEDRKENFRRVRKALEKHEHNYQYGSDSEYSSSSEDEEEAAEREKLEAEKQKALGPSSQQLDPAKLTGAPPSGATTPIVHRERRPGTPSDREGKQKRKRPGSPYLSEAGSGTDTSTRAKKPKTSHEPRSDSKLKIRGPGSDTDAGIVSDATRRLKKRHKSSQNPSRAGSPAPPREGATSPPALNLMQVAPPEKIRQVVLANPEMNMNEFLVKMGVGGIKDKGAFLKHFGAYVKVSKIMKDGVEKKWVVLKDPPSTTS